MPKAARLHDPIAHTYAREGHAAGAAAAVGIEFGAAVAIGAVVGTIACPGLGTAAGIAIGIGVAVASFVVAHAFSLVGDFVQSFGEAFGRSFTSDCGTLTATGSTTVFINGKPAIRTGLDVATCDKHSMPTSLVIFGSENVFIDSYRAAREGDCVDCEAKISKGSEDVFIGGESVPVANFREREVPQSDREFASKARFWAGILGGAAGALKAGVKCFGMAVLSGVVGAKVMGEILPSFDGGHSAATGAGDSAGTALGNFLQGKPVHVVTGAKVLLGDDDTDFSLPGALPIAWRRAYASCDARTGALGTGWSLPFSVELVFEGGKAHFIDEAGRDIPFDDLPPGAQMFSVPEGVQLSRGEGGAYFIGMPALGWIYCFGQRAGSSDGERLGLQQWADFNGNTIDFHRDADGVVRHVTDSAGHRLALRYAQAGGLRLVRVDLTAGGPAGTLVEYRYDAQGQLAQVIDRLGRCVRRFTWEGTTLVSQTFASGLVARYRWDRPAPEGRVVQHWLEDAAPGMPATAWTFEYDLPGERPGDRRTRVTDHLGRVQLFDHDADQNVTRIEDPLGQVQRMEWNDLWQLLAWTRADGSRFTFTYDRLGNLTGATDPLGQTARLDWHERLQRVRAATAVDGTRWHYTYDDRGNRTEVLGPPLDPGAPPHIPGDEDEARWRESTLHDPRGLPVVTIDANGGRQQWAWDERALLVRHTDCSGKTTRFEYDANGFLSKHIDALGQTTHYVHDALGRLLSVTQADGTAERYTYDGADQLVSAGDSSNRLTHYRYDIHGKLLALQRPDGITIHLGYDGAHRLASLVSENGATYRFAYDTANRMVQELRPDGSRRSFAHDALGRVVALREDPGEDDVTEHAIPGHAPAASIQSAYERDAIGRLIEKRVQAVTRASSPQDTIVQRFAYDRMNRLVRAETLDDAGQSPVQAAEFGYSLLGDLDLESARDADAGTHIVLRHTHDPLGNRLATELPDGRVLRHLHYGSGHVHQISLDGVVVADIERDDLHREVLRTQGRWASRWAYDPLGRRRAQWTQSASLRVGADWAGQMPDASAASGMGMPSDGLRKQWDYDASGELVRTRHSRNGETRYRYDPAGHVLSATLQAAGAVGGASPALQQALHEVFHYDPAGNRLDAPVPQGAEGSRGWVRHNRVKVLQDKRYDYDGFGRLVRKRIGAHTELHCRYDALHRMTHASVIRAGRDGEPLRQVFRYRYDPLGRRIAKEDDFGATRFVWEGLRLLQESRGAQTSTYVYEPASYRPLARIDGAGLLEPEHPVSVLALAGEDPRGDPAAGKVRSVPVTNGDASDAHHAVAGPVGATARYLAELEAERKGTAEKSTSVRMPEPDLAQQTASASAPSARIYYFHLQPNGLPEEMSDRDGHLVWRAQYRIWGSAVTEEWQTFDAGRAVDATAGEAVIRTLAGAAPIAQNLRMQGQYLDRETGLHYNTFRYYDPDIGRFISQDPIGLAGGVNLYQYAPNPIYWADPLGLCRFGKFGQSKTRRINKIIEKNKSNKGNAKVFENSDGVLPRRRDGKSITYTEHDYNTPPTPAQRANGADRGKRRVVIGSDNRVYYTNDHYRSFERFK
ncbi:RHS repeat-associated core domain-containing protein [Paracidovorax citrulli]|uniref:YD repeat protein n=2 Tax=Paracidovorax citrulli TaxID=80869 RepID=A1TSG5_PARC0|nr:RHS repeat-associated core domain-containing protein [Paracidovorax citrulli]ABM33903.1 YD repeat protein [Paracidovorax citrulli AAC00-1]ATG94470.1 sugar-binding protein [Paracidovorax citrulli]PVY63339.1 RHS repeat-associated protein [Paracidovorax citrulli]QCX12376.1 putative deoxyribonuclease RhsB [Paracidovorax citrulli]REG67690.1 RHS repeat-associated protein [Paracidovorax citrulli]